MSAETPDQHVEVTVPEEAFPAASHAVADLSLAATPARIAEAAVDAAAPFIAAKAVEEKERELEQARWERLEARDALKEERESHGQTHEFQVQAERERVQAVQQERERIDAVAKDRHHKARSIEAEGGDLEEAICLHRCGNAIEAALDQEGDGE